MGRNVSSHASFVRFDLHLYTRVAVSLCLALLKWWDFSAKNEVAFHQPMCSLNQTSSLCLLWPVSSMLITQNNV